MEILRTIAEVRAWRAERDEVGLVATMGNLHVGHLALAEAAAARCRHVLASIFVNPLQFGPSEDLDNYPRTFDADCAALESRGVDAVFAPSVAEMYPTAGASATVIRVTGLSEVLCGAHRPGHFDGVATVVCKLFNITTPTAAFFGEKDYQQLSIVRRMALDLCLPVDVVGVATVREASGLAYSSRNGYLSAAEREQAVVVSATVAAIRERLIAGERDFFALEADGRARLEAAGITPDYVEIRDDDLAAPTPDTDRLRVFAAGYLGRTRLIDNMSTRATG